MITLQVEHGDNVRERIYTMLALTEKRRQSVRMVFGVDQIELIASPGESFDTVLQRYEDACVACYRRRSEAESAPRPEPKTRSYHMGKEAELLSQLAETFRK